MSISPEETRRLVRRDLAVAGIGSLVALWSWSLVLAGSLDFIPESTADTVVVIVAIVIGLVSTWWWAAGPPEMMRHRYFVLVPLFLAAGPGLFAAHRLGGGLPILAIGTGIAFFGAAVLGFGLSANRRRARSG